MVSNDIHGCSAEPRFIWLPADSFGGSRDRSSGSKERQISFSGAQIPEYLELHRNIQKYTEIHRKMLWKLIKSGPYPSNLFATIVKWLLITQTVPLDLIALSESTPGLRNCWIHRITQNYTEIHRKMLQKHPKMCAAHPKSTCTVVERLGSGREASSDAKAPR